MRRLRNFLLLIFASALIVCAGLVFYVSSVMNYQNPAACKFLVQKGDSVRAIAAQLENEEVIKSRLVFEAYLRFTGKSGAIRVGEYEIPAALTMTEIAERLIAGVVITYRFTIPEGYNLNDIRKVLQQKKLITPAEFERQSRRVELLREHEGISTLEGYLFPDTYIYDSQMTPPRLFETLVGNFYKRLGPERLAKVAEKNMTLHQLVTLASVVEKETGLASERPLIAGVFFNRLKIGMMLQSDPTVIYGIPNFNGNLTKLDLLRDSPYNTYTRMGLPAGPICNVGIEAIDAVLNPATTKAIYFVAKGDGSHFFSETLDQHNRAVQYFQLKRGEKPE